MKTQIKTLEGQIPEFARLLEVEPGDISLLSLIRVMQRRVKGGWKEQAQFHGIGRLYEVLRRLQGYREFSTAPLSKELLDARAAFDKRYAEWAEMDEDDPNIRRQKRMRAERKRAREKAAA
jgi:hypothetical protein